VQHDGLSLALGGPNGSWTRYFFQARYSLSRRPKRAILPSCSRWSSLTAIVTTASRSAAGWTTATIVPRGDVEALVQATRRALSGHPTAGEPSAATGTRAGAGGVDTGPRR